MLSLAILAIVLFNGSHSTVDVSIIKDGEELDIEKQKAEGNLEIEEDRTKIETDLSKIETELLDKSVFAGAEIIQEYDIDSDSDEDVIIVIEGEGEEQVIVIHANETDTDIEIDIDREDRESVDVEFNVDHAGETYVVELDEEGDEVISESYRVDEQELNVYVEENTDGNYVVYEDDIEIEVYVDIDDIDLDINDYVDFDIGLYGEKDYETNDDVFVSGKYATRKEKRVEEFPRHDPDPQDTAEFGTGEEYGFENLVAFDCSTTVTFEIPRHTVVRQGRRFEQMCTVSEDILPSVLSFEWLKLDPESDETDVVATQSNLVVRNTHCKTAATYKCRVTYLCEDEVRTAESEEMALIVDMGTILNPMCQIFGDPHVVTFDQRVYSFQGECTYLLAMDAMYGGWYIYGKFTKCGRGTCLESVIVYAEDYAIELQRGWVINQNGRKLDIKEGKSLSPDETLSLYYDGYEVFVELFDPQIQLSWDGLMNLKIEIASEEKTLGLCGNNNQDPDDDFMTWYGNVLDDPTEFGHKQAIDRNGICQRPIEVENVGDTKEARAHCEHVLLNGVFRFTSDYLEKQILRMGGSSELVRSDRLLDMCIFDYMAGMHVEELTPECYSGYSYFSISKRLGMCIPEGWQSSAGCLSKTKLQDITIAQGCPYGNSPLPFNRN